MATESQRGVMPNDARNEESGQFVPKYPDEAFLNAVRELGEATTSEVAAAVGADHDTARRRLHALVDDGQIRRRKIAATIVWSPAEVEA